MPTKTDLLIHGNRLGPEGMGEIISVNPRRAGWRYISFGAHALRPGERLSAETGDVRSRQGADDPTYAWVRETWAPRERDARLDRLIGGKEWAG